MARVTSEDCELIIPDHFELCLVAARRAKDISAGDTLKVERNNDKNTVVALREIAGEYITATQLRENLIRSFQRNIPLEDEDNEDLADFMSGEQAWITDDSITNLDDLSDVEEDEDLDDADFGEAINDEFSADEQEI